MLKNYTTPAENNVDGDLIIIIYRKHWRIKRLGKVKSLEVFCTDLACDQNDGGLVLFSSLLDPI